jgi:hypothetical protein
MRVKCFPLRTSGLKLYSGIMLLQYSREIGRNFDSGGTPYVAYRVMAQALNLGNRFIFG